MITCVAVGRVGQDPELRTTPSGVPVTKFSIASTSRVGDRDITTWIRCVAWQGAAEAIAKYVRKGNAFSVTGNLRDNRWKDTDGRERITTELHVSQFQLLPNGQRPTENAEQGSAQGNETPDTDSVDTSDMP